MITNNIPRERTRMKSEKTKRFLISLGSPKEILTEKVERMIKVSLWIFR